MRQRASLWGKIMRTIVFSDVLRDATDWELGADLDVIGTGANGEIDASGGTVYGFLIDSIFDVSTEDLVVLLSDSTDQTLTAETGIDFGAGEMGTELEENFVVEIPPASSATQAQIHGYAIPNGWVGVTNIQFMANLTDGANVTANDVRVHVVYRTDTEVRVFVRSRSWARASARWPGYADGIAVKCGSKVVPVEDSCTSFCVSSAVEDAGMASMSVWILIHSTCGSADDRSQVMLYYESWVFRR